MSRFYASIQGSRGETTRQGTADSGIHGHIRGWNSGCLVEISPDPENPETDLIEIYSTNGSNGDTKKLIATIQNGLTHLDR